MKQTSSSSLPPLPRSSGDDRRKVNFEVVAAVGDDDGRPHLQADEMDRIYGRRAARASVQRRMTGPFVENPFSEPFKQRVIADVAETRFAEHLHEQAIRRNKISVHLEKEKDHLIERGRQLKKEMAAARRNPGSAPMPSSKASVNLGGSMAPEGGLKPRITITELEPLLIPSKIDLDLPQEPAQVFPANSIVTTMNTAKQRKDYIHGLIRQLPEESEAFERKKSAFEHKLYHHRVNYQNEYGPDTYEPWQQENADMIRSMVYDLVDVIMDAYEGQQKEKQAQMSISSSKIEKNNDDNGVSSSIAKTAVSHQPWQLRQKQHLENASLERSCQLEGDGIAIEVSGDMVAEVVAEEIELLRLCQEFAKTNTIKAAWALANPGSASKGDFPKKNVLTKFDKNYATFFEELMMKSNENQ